MIEVEIVIKAVLRMRIPNTHHLGESQNKFERGWKTSQIMTHTIYEPAFDDGTGGDIIQSTIDEYIRRRSGLSQNYINISGNNEYSLENNKGAIEVRFGNYDSFLEYVGNSEVDIIEEYIVPVIINLNGYEDERGEFPSFCYAINIKNLRRYIEENIENPNVVAYITDGEGYIWDSSVSSGDPFQDELVIVAKLDSMV